MLGGSETERPSVILLVPTLAMPGEEKWRRPPGQLTRCVPEATGLSDRLSKVTPPPEVTMVVVP